MLDPQPRRMQLGTLRAAVLLAALLAFAWQSFVTQTHVHPAPHVHSLTSIDKAEQALHSKTGEPSRDQPANCPICQEIAHAGLYLLPAQVEFDMPPPAIAWVAVIPPLAAPVRLGSHIWRSRAPPHQLQV